MAPVEKTRGFGIVLLKTLEYAGLAIISVATAVAIGQEVAVMVSHGQVRLADLLLLFIYLEVLAMVTIYIESGQLPVRLPLYIGMVALARYLILDMKDMTPVQLLAVSAAILLLAGAVLVVRYGHVRYPYGRGEEGAQGDKH